MSGFRVSEPESIKNSFLSVVHFIFNDSVLAEADFIVLVLEEGLLK